MPSAPRRCRTWTAGNRAKAAALPPRPAAATTRRHRCRQEPATKLTGGTQCACLAALFGQPAVHTSQAHSAPSNLPKIYIYVPCTPHTLTCTAGSLGRLGKRACRLPAGGCRWSHGKAGRVSRDRQAALPGGSARCPRLRSFPEPCAVAGGPRGPPSAAGKGLTAATFRSLRVAGGKRPESRRANGTTRPRRRRGQSHSAGLARSRPRRRWAGSEGRRDRGAGCGRRAKRAPNSRIAPARAARRRGPCGSQD